jgi:hypothetical protein
VTAKKFVISQENDLFDCFFLLPSIMMTNEKINQKNAKHPMMTMKKKKIKKVMKTKKMMMMMMMMKRLDKHSFVQYIKKIYFSG